MKDFSPTAYPLIVFDWDGTLMDSIGNMVTCALHAFDEAGMPAPDAQAIRSAIGLGLAEVAERVLPPNDPVARGRIMAQYRELWLGTYRYNVKLYDGVRETLQALAKRGHVLAIATGRGRPGLMRDLAATDLEPHFAVTRTADDAEPKPHPQMLLDVIASQGKSPSEALMIGDTTYDLEMAHRAEVASVGVLTGSHGRQELEPWGPLACLPSVSDLPTYLGSEVSAP